MKKSCKFVIFSDLHYLPASCSNQERKLTKYAETMLNKLIEKVNMEIKPDFVVNLGDLIEDQNDYEKDLESYRYIYHQLQSFQCPVYSATGNHDLKMMNDRVEIENIMGVPHSTYSFDSSGYHFVFLGLGIKKDFSIKSGGIKRTQWISEEDIKWLREDLSHHSLPTILFCHFGLAEDDMKGNWWFEQNSEAALLKNRKEIKKILNQHQVLAVFSGHQHWTKHITEEQINYYILGSMVENIHQDGIPDGVYMVVEISNHEFKVREEHLQL